MRGDAGRALKILALRKRKAEEEVSRVLRGIAAGEGLRQRLIAADGDAPLCPELTIPYVTRTVAILERGLAVLAEQKADALQRRERMEQAVQRLTDQARERAVAAERTQAERAIGEILAVRRPSLADKADASEPSLARAVPPVRSKR